MNNLLIITVGLTVVSFCHGYVATLKEETPKNEPQIPLTNRKLFNGYKRFSVRERGDDISNDLANTDSNVDKLMFSIDTGAQNKVGGENKDNNLEKVVKKLGELVSSPGNPVFRAAEGYNIKPEIVHFRANKPSVKFEINSQSVINAIRDLLSSHTVRRYADDLAQKAAIVFNVIKEEMAKGN